VDEVLAIFRREGFAQAAVIGSVGHGTSENSGRLMVR
jgi:hypothetical protein